MKPTTRKHEKYSRIIDWTHASPDPCWNLIWAVIGQAVDDLVAFKMEDNTLFCDTPSFIFEMVSGSCECGLLVANLIREKELQWLRQHKTCRKEGISRNELTLTI